MSVILQPYQALPFNTSLDFQVSRQKGGSLCDFENIIDEGNFIPFAILSPDFEIGEINVFNCSDEFVQALTLTIVSEQDIETGLWFHYYAGADLGLSCGTYYISILVGDFIWYSEQFTIRDVVNASQYPELIKDDYHLPLRIYDSITKQLANKTDIGCNVQPLNPLSSIMPFMFDTDEDINSLNVFLVDTCSLEETDLSADLELEFIKSNPGTIVEQEVLTTSQQLRNEYYSFDTKNYVFQEIKINDTGKLKNILFEWLFNNEAQTITIDLILGTNPSAVPVITKTITDNAVLEKELTIDYSLNNINVTAGQIYILKFSTDADCTAGIGVNSVKVYADGQFAERNNIGQIKDYSAASLNGTFEFSTGSWPNYDNWYKLATFSQTASPDACYGVEELPAAPTTYSFKHTAVIAEIVKLSLNNFKYEKYKIGDDGYLKIKLNGLLIYEDFLGGVSGIIITCDPVNMWFNLSIGDILTVEYYYELPGDYNEYERGQCELISGDILITTYNYGSVVSYVYYPTGIIPEGILYQNKSLWFYCNITKEVFINGTGATQIYNPGRPLPSPLICGNYYLKLVSALHTWYSEWFRVINVGRIDLTVFVLGTESGEIIITEDETTLIEL